MQTEQRSVTLEGFLTGIGLGCLSFRLCRAVLYQRLSFLGNGKIPRSCIKSIKVTKIFNSNQPLVFESRRHSKRL